MKQNLIVLRDVFNTSLLKSICKKHTFKNVRIILYVIITENVNFRKRKKEWSSPSYKNVKTEWQTFIKCQT